VLGMVADLLRDLVGEGCGDADVLGDRAGRDGPEFLDLGGALADVGAGGRVDDDLFALPVAGLEPADRDLAVGVALDDVDARHGLEHSEQGGSQVGWHQAGAQRIGDVDQDLAVVGPASSAGVGVELVAQLVGVARQPGQPRLGRFLPRSRGVVRDDVGGPGLTGPACGVGGWLAEQDLGDLGGRVDVPAGP
jgi:hypothetical protein